MRNTSKLPMEPIDVHLLSDIIEHFLNSNRESVQVIRDSIDDESGRVHEGFHNDDADAIIADLKKVEDLADDDTVVRECTSYTAEDETEESFLDLNVTGYVKMRREYYEECHNPYR